MNNSVHLGDCLEIMPTLEADSVDSIVTDPPYGLSFMGKNWDHGVPGVAYWIEALRVAKPGAYLLAFGGTRTFHRLAVAIEDAGWEMRDTIGWLYAQGFPKGQDIAWELHKKACLLCGVMVVYGHEEIKSDKRSNEGKEKTTTQECSQETKHDLRFVRAAYLQTPVYACAKCGQVLQPFMSEQEAQSLRQTWSKSKIIWPKQSGMERRDNTETPKGELQGCSICQMSHGVFADGSEGWVCNETQTNNGSISWQIANQDGSCPSYRPQSIEQLNRQSDAFRVERQAQKFRGWNLALKPAWEPIIVARKPIEKTVAENVLKYGTGGINVDGCRVPTTEEDCKKTNRLNVKDKKYNTGIFNSGVGSDITNGRFPANLIHDGSDEVLAVFPESKSGAMLKPYKYTNNGFSLGSPTGSTKQIHGASEGSASRFFYCAKSSKRDRDEGLNGKLTPIALNTGNAHNVATLGRETAYRNNHPTVKPTTLMRYLCKLVTQPNGLILDPFCGSGSTGKAAILEGFRFIGIDEEKEYVDIAKKRIAKAEEQGKLFG